MFICIVGLVWYRMDLCQVKTFHFAKYSFIFHTSYIPPCHHHCRSRLRVRLHGHVCVNMCIFMPFWECFYIFAWRGGKKWKKEEDWSVNRRRVVQGVGRAWDYDCDGYAMLKMQKYSLEALYAAAHQTHMNTVFCRHIRRAWRWTRGQRTPSTNTTMPYRVYSWQFRITICAM